MIYKYIRLMGVVYSYFFPKEEEYQFDTDDINFMYSVYYDEENPFTKNNLILHNIQCAVENLKQ